MDETKNQVNEIEREFTLLNLLAGGYIQTSALHQEAFHTISIQTVRRILRNLYDHGFVRYKELPTKHGQGAGERVHYLTPEGMKLLGKEKNEITQYAKGLQRIRSTHLRHFLATREIEKSLLNAVHKTSYSAVSTNEFNDEGMLHLKLKDGGKIANVRSDAIVKITRNGNERLTMRLEMDMGTESVPTLLQKYQVYTLYLQQTNLVSSHAQTFPLYILLVAQETTIRNLVPKLRNHPMEKAFLFLPSEKIAAHDLFHDAVFETTKGDAVSLASLVEERDTILTFQEAMREAAQDRQNYEIVVQSRFSQICDSFFPVPLSLPRRETLFMPDAYVRMWYKCLDKILEILFGVVVAIRNETKEEIAEKLLPCEVFLSEPQYRNKIFSTEAYGVFVIVEQETRISEVWEVLRGSKIGQRARVIRKEDCTAEKILQEAVWVDESGERIALLPR